MESQLPGSLLPLELELEEDEVELALELLLEEELVAVELLLELDVEPVLVLLLEELLLEALVLDDALPLEVLLVPLVWLEPLPPPPQAESVHSSTTKQATLNRVCNSIYGVPRFVSLHHRRVKPPLSVK